MASASLPAFDPAAIADGRPLSVGPLPELQVRDYGPEAASADPRIRVRFNQPVVDMRQPPQERSPIALELRALPVPEAPPGSGRVVPCTSQWTAPDVLELRPDEDLPAATPFEVTLPAGLRNRDGSTLGELRWRFETARPQVWLVEPHEPRLAGEPLYLATDQPLAPEALAEHLRVSMPPRALAEPEAVEVRGRPVPAREVPEMWASALEIDDEDGPWVWAVEPRDEWVPGVKGTVRVGEGLRSSVGPLGLGEALVARFAVFDRPRVLGFECERPQGISCEPGPMRVKLTSDVAWDAEPPPVTVTPRPENLKIEYGTGYFDEDEDEDEDEEDEDELFFGFDEDRYLTIEIDGDFVPGSTYQVTVSGSLTDEHGQVLGRRWRRRVRLRDASPRHEQPGPASLRLSDERGTYTTARGARLGILTEHVREIRIRTATLDDPSRLRALAASRLSEVPFPAEGVTVVARTLDASGEFGEAQEVLDLSTVAGPGDAVLVEVEAVALTHAGHREASLPPVRGLYQISDLGTEVVVGPARGVLRVTHATTAEPWAGVRVQLHARDGVRSLPASDADGLVRLPGAESMGSDAWVMLWGSSPDEQVALRLEPFRWSRRGMTWRGRYETPTADPPPAGLRPGERAMVAVQLGRGLYLPGDTVHLAGWAGISTPYGSLASRRAPVETPVVVELGRDDVVVSRRVRLDRHGRFSASLVLPPEAPLGRYDARAKVLGGEDLTTFLLADARIPTFEVMAGFSSDRLVRGAKARLSVWASYLSGGPTPVEHMDWRLSCRDGSFARQRFDWHWDFEADTKAFAAERDGVVEGGGEDPSSRVRVVIPTAELVSERPVRCHASVAVQDATLQVNGADTSFAVYPASTYVGLRPPPDANEGEPMTVSVVALDLEEQRVAQPGVQLVLLRQPPFDPRRDAASPPLVELERRTIDLVAEGDPARWVLPALTAGDYRVRATTTVDGVAIRTDSGFRVEPKPKPEPEPEPNPEPEPAASLPSATPPSPPPPRPRDFAIDVPDEVKAGEPLDVRIGGPWPSARGMLTVDHTGLRSVEPFELVEGEATVRITPRPGRGHGMMLHASVAEGGEDHVLPKLRTTSHRVVVLEDRTLDVEVAVPPTASPGQRTSLTVTVRDVDGQPVRARVAVWVVDDAIHQLRRPGIPAFSRLFDPVRLDLQQRTSGYDALLRPFVSWSWRRRSRSPRVRSASAKGKGAIDFELRTRFEAVPLFEGNVGTGPDGVVTLPLPLPDDLTRFRVTAVASAELPASVGPRSGPARFGSGEAVIAVSSPLMVRAVLPRVLRPGDEAQLAALVTPPEGQRGRVVVHAEGVGAHSGLEWRGPTRVERSVDGTGPVRVDFDARAIAPGEPTVRLRARFEPERGRAMTAAVERSLRVAVERTQVERAAIYGRIDLDEPVEIPVLVPEHARPDVGELSITLRSSAVGDLGEAARYLEDYPYGCLEQTASRLLPELALRGLGTRRPEAAAAEHRVRWAEGLDHLLAMQQPDGRFTYWPDSEQPASTYATAYATWALQLAAQAGEAVPARALERALAGLEGTLGRSLPRTAWARAQWRAEQTLVVHVLAQAGRTQAPGLREGLDDLFEHREALPLFGRAMLLMALHRVDPRDPRVATLRRQISTTIERLPGSAQPVEPGAGRYPTLFDSPARSHALVLMAWLQLDPDDALVDDLARGLRLRRSGGRWRNTQENAYALLALSAYARAREAVAPDHRITAWVGSRALGSAEHRGHDGAARTLHLPMAELLGSLGPDRTARVVLDREGVGAVHVRLGMEWAREGEAPARSQGVTLSRRLLDGDAPAGPLRAGRRYRLEVVVETDAPQHFLAIEVPLPAGLEAIDTRLGAGASARAGAEGRGHRGWASHQELHGDRVLLFADALSPGRYVHSIPVLATTPGAFALPAATAEAMYAPEVRARTTGSRVRVEPAPRAATPPAGPRPARRSGRASAAPAGG